MNKYEFEDMASKAKIRKKKKSTSFNILCNSSLASTTLSLSLLSTTNIRPWVFWK